MADKKSPPDNSALYAQLSKLQQTQDFDKALKVCNKILNVDPKDGTAFHCKMVCLLQNRKFDDALRQIADCPMSLDLKFEEAYCLYGMNETEKALAALNQVKAMSTKHKELKAQILHRLEKYEECFALYRDIIKNTSDEFETERMTNMAAVASCIPGLQHEVDEDETYELCYNGACNLLAQERWAEAEKALRKAEEMCIKFLEEDEEDSEEDIVERETGIIRVQIAFTLQMQGREKEAQAIYNQVLKSKPTDIGLVAVASNNLLTLNKDQNIFDSKKRIKAATAEGLEHKLTSSHQRAIARNHALLAMYTNQVNLCSQLIAELGKKFGVEEDDKSLIMAGVLSRGGRQQEAVDELLKNGKGDLEKILIASQILLEKGDIPGAIKLFDDLPAQSKYRPGLLSALVTLNLANNDRVSAAKLLKEAVTWNKKSKAGGDMAIVWRKTAEFHLKSDEPSVAAQSLEELLRLNPNDRQTLAQLVIAYSKFDLKKALDASRKLPEFTQGSVDVDALESSSFLGAKVVKKTPRPGGVASPKPNEEGKDILKKKSKKKKKKRMPKNYNPNVDPDPERWLPRRERTGYRKPKRDRRRAEKFTGAQGTAGAAVTEAIDYSNRKASAPAPQAAQSPVMSAPAGPRQQGRKPQQKKKKKGNKF